LPEADPATIRIVDRKRGGYVVEHLLCEPVELTEIELDTVAGGGPFSISAWLAASSGSSVTGIFTTIFVSKPTTVIENAVDNSVHISG
jgi:hypothetical protein